jgi:hypothetical protein
MPSSAWLNKSFLAMARTKLLPSRLSHHRTLWTAGGDSWLLEETAQQTTAHHTNKRYTAGLLCVQQLYLDADIFIIRHWRESTHPAGITPQGFLQTNTVLWLCSGKLKIVSDRNCLSKDVTASKYFNRGGGGGLARTRVPVPRYTHNCKCNSQHTFFRTSNQNLFLLSLDTHSNLRSMWNGKLENWKLPLPIQIGVEQIGNRQEALNYYWEDLFVFAFRLTNQLLWLCK